MTTEPFSAILLRRGQGGLVTDGSTRPTVTVVLCQLQRNNYWPRSAEKLDCLHVLNCHRECIINESRLSCASWTALFACTQNCHHGCIISDSASTDAVHQCCTHYCVSLDCLSVLCAQTSVSARCACMSASMIRDQLQRSQLNCVNLKRL